MMTPASPTEFNPDEPIPQAAPNKLTWSMIEARTALADMPLMQQYVHRKSEARIKRKRVLFNTIAARTMAKLTCQPDTAR